MSGNASSRAPRGRRRGVLLALLLAGLIGMLIMRPDLRVPAGRLVAQTSHALLFETLGISPRRVYAGRLWIAGLYAAPIGRRWRRAVADADPQSFKTRLGTSLDFRADRITAGVFTTELERGMALRWRLDRDDRARSGRLYATLERRDTGDHWRNVASLAADGQPDRYVVAAGGRYRLVFQPELAADVRAELAVVRGGSLPFPVVGGHAYDIGGGFGAPRDGGARQHKGVDIFADRDTPVRAVVDGRIATGNGGLGGHYIWLSGGFASPRFYYAHLDHFAVGDGAHVTKGDVIGYVGNSGNAAGGPTHLHFGIYTAGGAIDPAPFIRPMPKLPIRRKSRITKARQ